MLAVRLPKEIDIRLTMLAQQTGRTKTFYVREAILEYLDDLEDYYLAASRLEENLPFSAFGDGIIETLVLSITIKFITL